MRHAHLSLLLAAVLGAQSTDSTSPLLRRSRPLTCRGGPGLVFDTLATESGRVQLSLVFTASAGYAGPEGQGLEPGQCGWVGRSFSEREPRRIHLSIGASDSTPALSVLDSAVYWGFIALGTDSGYIRAFGYRHWHASSPPVPAAPAAAPAPSRRSVALPFDVRYLPLFALAIGAIIGIPGTVLIGRWSGWRRLAERYPDRNTGRGTSIRSGQIVMNKSLYKMGVRFTMDESHLHIAMSMLARLGHRPLSVPWSEVEAARDEWPWFPFKGEPMLRLTFGAHPDIRMLVRTSVGERLMKASGGRLTLERSGAPAGSRATAPART